MIKEWAHLFKNIICSANEIFTKHFFIRKTVPDDKLFIPQ
jgi:hypothetical protein